MAAQAEEGSKLDIAKWLIVLAIVIAGIYGNYYFSEQPLYLRILGLVGLAAVAFYTAIQTVKGRNAWLFVQESRAEVRKVVWPTRKETTHATMIVIVMVLVVAVFLWILDSILGRIAAWFIGG